MVLRRQRAVAEPQVPLLSPVFPLATMISLPLAMTINIVLHYWLGLAGMHLLLTSALGLSFAPLVFYLSIVAVMAGAPAMHLAVGHSVFLPCFYLPPLAAGASACGDALSQSRHLIV
jgi:hypothetical protein